MAKARRKKAKMRAGTCKCVSGGRRRLCKTKGGKVKFTKGACRRKRSKR
jgi:hypothetical protein